MDNTRKTTDDQNLKTISDTPTDLAHITQEMYKKNFQLAETNKTLSLLRKIDEIILTSVNDKYQLSQKVADIAAADAGFKLVVIYLIEEKNTLNKIAYSNTEYGLKLYKKLEINPFPDTIKLTEDNNPVVKAIKEKEIIITEEVRSILYPNVLGEILYKVEELNEMKSTIICPLKTRNELLGVLIVNIGETKDSISQFQKDLIERLGDIIGIAVDNALLYKELKEANERLKQLDRLKDDFVSVASHELRTPMTAIKSYLWMTLAGQGGALNEKQTKYVQRAYNSADRLIKLVNDMLNISRIDSGRLSVHIQSIKIQDLTREIIDEISPRAVELGINLEIDINSQIPDVMADPDKIKEVLYNLIGNSLKFTENGGKITVSFVQKNDIVEISIIDNGAGIDVENLPKMFQKFGILPGSYVTNQPTFGTGLGLYICRSLIELHGGKIWAKSDGKGKGATFSFTLKVFNQDDFIKFQKEYNQSINQNLGLIHEPLP